MQNVAQVLKTGSKITNSPNHHAVSSSSFVEASSANADDSQEETDAERAARAEERVGDSHGGVATDGTPKYAAGRLLRQHMEHDLRVPFPNKLVPQVVLPMPAKGAHRRPSGSEEGAARGGRGGNQPHDEYQRSRIIYPTKCFGTSTDKRFKIFHCSFKFFCFRSKFASFSNLNSNFLDNLG